MKKIFSKRLKSARTQAALSQDELVHRINGLVSKNAISKYEKGEMMADGKVLIALAKALEVKPDYFFRPFTVKIDQIEFRKKKRLSVKHGKAIKQKVTDMVERYLEVEQFLSIESTFTNPIENISITSREDVEYAVKQLLDSWKLGYNALPNVIGLLEDKEIKVVEIDAPDEFDGFSAWADAKYPIIVINKKYGIERKRLTALHELAHLLLNFSDGIEHKEMERICFQFGAAMLMPDETVRMELGAHRSHIPISELILIKQTYGISIQAIMQRARDLGIITESTFITFRKRISRNRKEEGLGQYVGVEESNRFKQLVFRAAAEDIISMSKAANLFNQKLAEFRKEFVV